MNVLDIVEKCGARIDVEYDDIRMTASELQAFADAITKEKYVADLEKENAELRAKLDAWEKQSPVGYLNKFTEGNYFDEFKQFDCPDAVPLFTKPKES